MAIDVTETTFEQEVLQSDTPVLVDFWAEWCGPCHAVAPVLDKIVEEQNGELKLVKVNIDEEQGLSLRYGVMSIPTMILFRDGEPAAAAVGAQPNGSLERPKRPPETEAAREIGQRHFPPGEYPGMSPFSRNFVRGFPLPLP